MLGIGGVTGGGAAALSDNAINGSTNKALINIFLPGATAGLMNAGC
jgi:hypothetical protein